MESASIIQWRKRRMKYELNLRRRKRKKKGKKGKGRGGKLLKRVEDRGGSCRRRTSFAGSVSVTSKRSLVCYSHI